jgi:hypothetical protein
MDASPSTCNVMHFRASKNICTKYGPSTTLNYVQVWARVEIRVRQLYMVGSGVALSKKLNVESLCYVPPQ